jgi:hypothetical protein
VKITATNIAISDDGLAAETLDEQYVDNKYNKGDERNESLVQDYLAIPGDDDTMVLATPPPQLELLSF